MAAQAMRRILVDHARDKFKVRAKKHGPISLVSLDKLVGVSGSEQMVMLDEALKQAAPARAAPGTDLVELRFSLASIKNEIASDSGVSERTVQREWNVARAWLYREVSDSAGQQSRGRNEK